MQSIDGFNVLQIDESRFTLTSPDGKIVGIGNKFVAECHARQIRPFSSGAGGDLEHIIVISEPELKEDMVIFKQATGCNAGRILMEVFACKDAFKVPLTFELMEHCGKTLLSIQGAFFNGEQVIGQLVGQNYTR